MRSREIQSPDGRAGRTAIARLLAGGLALAGVWPCWAATQTVTSTNDSGAGSLRQAIANAAPGDTIVFQLPNPSVITLSSTLTIPNNLTIQGPGATQLAISGNQAVIVFDIERLAAVTISGLTVENGKGFFGGGVFNDGTLSIANSVLSGNSAAWGGGIQNSATLTVANCTLSNNSVSQGGGGINSDGTLTITNSTLSGNSAIWGGGIRLSNETSTFTITNNTVSGNSATQDGGGIRIEGGTGTLTNNTLSGNSAPQNEGGGIVTIPDAKMVTVKGMLLAGNLPNNCLFITAITSQGYNLSDDSTCKSELSAATDKNNTAADLDPKGLQNNGGPTQTIGLLPNSPAVDAISPAACTSAQGNPLTTDQRGIARPQGSGCDIGAFELVQNTPFSSFTAQLAILSGQPSGFGLSAGLAPGSASNGIHPLTDAVTLQIATYNVTIPAGSFHQLWNSPQAPYVYQGAINGTNLVASLISLGGGKYQFDAAGSPAAFGAGIKNPVTVSLTIGDNTGSAQVTALIIAR